jgi:hypothetical protein
MIGQKHQSSVIAAMDEMKGGKRHWNVLLRDYSGEFFVFHALIGNATINLLSQVSRNGMFRPLAR